MSKLTSFEAVIFRVCERGDACWEAQLERWHLCFYLNHKAAFSQQYGSCGKEYSGQGRDDSEVPMGSWGWPASLFKADE